MRSSNLTLPPNTYTEVSHYMLRRDNRQERREERGPGGGGKNHYQMRQKMFTIGDDFWIENDRREKVFKVDGKALRVRQTLILEDRSGKEIAKIQERMVRVKDSHEYTIGEGRDKIAEVSKKWFRLRDTYGVEIDAGQDDGLVLAIVVCIDEMSH